MKKYFLSIVALAGMLFATSCQESIVEPQVGGTTTFTVQVPNAMGTKAIGDASIIERLYVAVYENFDETQGVPQGLTAIYKTNVKVENGAATVALNLIQDQKYDIVFWAQNGESYVDADDELLSIPITNTFHNNEEGAAFFHFERNFEPKGNAKDIKLRRPFAQLNLGTTQGSLSTNAGNYTLKSSTITVSTVAEEFNTITGVGVDQNLNPTTYQANIDFSQALTVGGKDYTYVSMDYLPIPSESKILVNIDAVIVIEDENQNTKTISHSFKSVPVQENYRTNIVGNLISSSTDFNVVVDAEFDGELPQTDLEKLKFVAANGGEVILQDPVALVESLVITAGVTKSQAESSIPVVIDLNGHTISQSQVQTGAYSMINNRGNLTIKDSKGTGKIIYGDQGNGGNYPSNTILNSGVLVIEGGNFVNESSSNVVANGFPHVIDNNGDLIVRGGTFVNEEYSSVRIWANDNHTNVDIYAGQFTGAIDLQNPGTGANHIGNLNIYGGTFNKSNFANPAVVRFLNAGDDNSGMSINIFGGTFNNVFGRSSAFPVFDYSDIFHISGGIFSTVEVADQYKLSELLVDGYYVEVVDGKYIVLKEGEGVNNIVTTEDELQGAINNANVAGDYVIALGADIVCDGDILVDQKPGVNLVIEGNSHSFDGSIHIIYGTVNSGMTGSLLVRNVHFVTTNKDREYFIHGSADDYTTTVGYDYIHNVTIANCTFTGYSQSSSLYVFTSKSGTGVVGDNIRFENCNASGIKGFLSGYPKTVTLKNVKSYSAASGINLQTSFKSLSIENCEFITNNDADGYAVRVAGQLEGSIKIKDTKLQAYYPIYMRTPSYPITMQFEGTNELILNNSLQQPYQIYIQGNPNLVTIEGEGNFYSNK